MKSFLTEGLSRSAGVCRKVTRCFTMLKKYLTSPEMNISSNNALNRAASWTRSVKHLYTGPSPAGSRWTGLGSHGTASYGNSVEEGWLVSLAKGCFITAVWGIVSRYLFKAEEAHSLYFPMLTYVCDILHSAFAITEHKWCEAGNEAPKFSPLGNHWLYTALCSTCELGSTLLYSLGSHTNNNLPNSVLSSYMMSVSRNLKAKRTVAELESFV